MRGKPPPCARCLRPKRITPAGAGKTLRRTHLFNVQWDHPRRCGENAYLPNRKIEPDGSPPQVRGKPPPCARCLRPKRITPAGAGKTLRRTHLFNVQWDHPRRCGENRDELYVGCPQGGSPPQVRGKPAAEQGGGGIPRITPAGAGKTLQRTAVLNAGQDHPRRCGENLKLLQPLLRGLGSPPQVRGKPELSRIILMSHRITPAGAGKTRTLHEKRPTPKDHPRRCGENHRDREATSARDGSPPQVRGKPLFLVLLALSLRITPAGAGKTRVR